jgi:hypothetical protein
MTEKHLAAVGGLRGCSHTDAAKPTHDQGRACDRSTE